MTGYKDYYLLLSPGEEVEQLIAWHKQLAVNIIGKFPGCRTKAHLSIKEYVRQKPYHVNHAFDSLEYKLKRLPSIDFQLDSFNFFVHGAKSLTIYAAIKPIYTTDKWLYQLERELKLNRNEFIPHITVAKQINADSFFKLWPVFNYLRIHSRFHISDLHILKRDTLNTERKWERYKQIKFGSSVY